MRTNSERFISAFNRIDKNLRTKYNLRSNMTFPEVIRKSANQSVIIKKSEEELIDYSRLRNSIVHSANGNFVIAEPHLSVVEDIERIDRLVAKPPIAQKYAHKAVTIDYNATLKEAMSLMVNYDYSNLPVIKDDSIIGVINNKFIVESIAKAVDKDLNLHINSVNVGSVISNKIEYYRIIKSDSGIDFVLEEFLKTPKLSIVILTSNGEHNGDIQGVITTGNIFYLNKIIEEADY